MEQHLIAPRHGRIRREWLAEESNEYRLVVEEESLDDTLMVIYEWDAGWDLVSSFRMGFFDEYMDTIDPRVANIVDVGESTIDEQDAIVVVEENRNGFWLLIYEWQLVWERWALGLAYFVDGHYAAPELNHQRDDDAMDNIGDEIVIGLPLRRESTPSLSDNDYQDLEE